MKSSSKTFGVGAAVFGAMTLCAASGAAVAGSITQPGELVGLSLATPLPEGVYFVDTGSIGNDRGQYNSLLGVNIPVIAWSTPWTFLGGRVYGYAAVPSVSLGAHDLGGVPGTSLYVSALYNPALLVGEAWDLGNGFSFGTTVGGYAPVSNALNQDFFTFNVRPSVAWAGDGWALSANVVLGITGTNHTAQGPFGIGGLNNGWKTSPNYVNYDLAALKTFDKWTLGVVGFGSADISGVTSPWPLYPAYSKQNQFAVGGFVGYNFGPVTLQTYLTHDVISHNYGQFVDNLFTGTTYFEKVYDTRFWMRVVVPLWNPAPAPAPIVAKY
jgi:hypothetical protein